MRGGCVGFHFEIFCDRKWTWERKEGGLPELQSGTVNIKQKDSSGQGCVMSCPVERLLLGENWACE